MASSPSFFPLGSIWGKRASGVENPRYTVLKVPIRRRYSHCVYVLSRKGVGVGLRLAPVSFVFVYSIESSTRKKKLLKTKKILSQAHILTQSATIIPSPYWFSCGKKKTKREKIGLDSIEGWKRQRRCECVWEREEESEVSQATSLSICLGV